MELRQLEAFAAVMSTGSVTAAGRLLGGSQPAISRLLLEAEIGYALFSRSGPRVTPTEQGFLLYEDVERALAGMRQIRERAGEIARGQASPPDRRHAGAGRRPGAPPCSACRQARTPPASSPIKPPPDPHPAAPVGPGRIQLRSASPERVVHAVLTGAAQLRDQPAAGAPRPDGALDRSGRLRGCLAGQRSAGRARSRAGVGAGRPPAHHHGQSLPPAPPPGRRAGRQRAGRRHHRDQLVHQRALAAVRRPGRVGAGAGHRHGTPMPGVAIRSIDLDIPFFFGVITPQAQPPSSACLTAAATLAERPPPRCCPVSSGMTPANTARCCNRSTATTRPACPTAPATPPSRLPRHAPPTPQYGNTPP